MGSGGEWLLVVYAGAAVLAVAVMLLISHVLGERHEGHRTALPFESGVLPTDSARIGIAARFYLVAIAFVIFDVEAIFLFGWAIAVREVGFSGLIAATVFIGVLALALAYLVRAGVLGWGGSPVRAQERIRLTGPGKVER